MYASIQEKLVHAASSNGLGYLNLFLPDNFDGNKEPCDLAWVSDKIAVIFNCTSGKKSTENQNKHNVNQFKKWIRVWKSGVNLKGKNSSRLFDVSFNEILKILFISIIESEEEISSCIDTCIATGTDKISVGYSISSKVIYNLFSKGGNYQDLINICMVIKQEKRVSDKQLIDTIDQIYQNSYSAAYRHALADILKKPAFECTPSHFTYGNRIADAAKSQPCDDRDIAVFWTDIGIPEIAWMNAVTSVADLTIGKTIPGTSGPAFLMVKYKFHNHILMAFAANINIMTEKLEQIAEIGFGDGIGIFTSYIGDSNQYTMSSIVYDKPIFIDRSLEVLRELEEFNYIQITYSLVILDYKLH